MLISVVPDSWSATRVLFKVFLVFIIVAVKAQQFPIAAVRGIIVMVVVLVMDREFAQFPACEFAAAPGTDVRMHFERLFAIG